ncbi:hypothetical protein CPC735_030350 [Coccidioides posadasii C735 delta SOWgp]|uniref:endo-1,3(4)-beta-glucanase n=1 Tax=Coccidioides posadasii (strain C735) TaxID=222929 RepID=C5P4Q9_COCP7|nr:hypothetical protein CPC735_030350 [Coccidioides posadasii C735 delta SOWgp]EER27699.1 hypothetical protein CPC735_030350 [Coccidioides posadasii C735 delta SOWgp]|eukprot:XP_003069844.1 hypothetical protein CPC735_030350 [Coccidioides posadasii C735 delta SOWgp]
MVSIFLLFVSALLWHEAVAVYELVDNYAGNTFFSNFTFFTEPDPTQGFVKYIGEPEARKNGLIGFSSSYSGDNMAWMSVDRTNVAPMGRESVRITSKKVYNQGLFIVDIAHVPTTTCGTWPAFWMYGPDWPHGGEIDIYEGVNLEYQNSMTLHTGPGCTVSRHAESTGRMTTTNCDVAAAGQKPNEGCKVRSQDPLSFGAGLNAVAGGMYATEWTVDAIKIWFFPRTFQIPYDITQGTPDPNTWGLPTAHFAGNCSFTNSFKDLRIVINTTFCGQWAGQVWGKSPCASVTSTCEEFVANYPEAFLQSYWAINSIKVYEKKPGWESA